MIKNCLKNIETTVNWDESVAEGCCILSALYSKNISANNKIKINQVLDNNIYLKWNNREPFIILESGSTYPTKKTIKIKTVQDMEIMVSYNGLDYHILGNIVIPKGYTLLPDDYLKININVSLNNICSIHEINLYQLKEIEIKSDKSDKPDKPDKPDKAR